MVHQPRLCHVVKEEGEGYGFNLYTGKGEVKGQFVGKVDPDSPAELAGLKVGDRVVEVNGVNITNENHKQVVARIKAVENETKLLVVDKEADEYFSEKGIVITGSMAGIKMMKTPSKTLANGSANDSDSPRSSVSSEGEVAGPPPRLCHIVKWHGAEGYGFHLLTDKTKAGQFIGSVDPDSPAAEAGLLAGDRIVEVNGSPTIGETHKNVIEKIKAVPNETKLLVLDPEADKYYRERNIVVSSSSPNVKYYKTPSSAPKNNNNVEKKQVHTVSPVSQTLTAGAPAVRLCHITKPPNEGYGFHLLSDKNKPGKFIGPIETGSPAYNAGLREGDRLIEVNGENAEELTHKEIVMRIKESPNQTKLLVVDAQADSYYKEKGIAITSKLSSVKVLKNSDKKPEANGVAIKESKSLSQLDEQRKSTPPSQARPQSQMSMESNDSSKSATPRPVSTVSSYDLSSRSTTPRPKSTLSSPDGLDLPMSAAEMRARLLSKKKYDPKKEEIDLRRKYEIIQSM